MEDLKVSLVQADLFWEQTMANLAYLEELIWANEADSDIIILPEMFTTAFSMNTSLADPLGKKTLTWMKNIASSKKSAVMGSVMMSEQGNFYNRLYFVSPDGNVVQYDKRHLFSLVREHKNYTQGNQKLIVNYKGWKICPLICYDLRFPVWSRSRSSEENLYEYDLLVYVANWPTTRINVWNTLLPARAIENGAYAIGVNRVGTDGFNASYNGHSGVYSFLGEQLAFSKAENSIINYTLSADNLQDYRKKFQFQNDGDRFEFLE